LNLVEWQAGVHPESIKRPDVGNLMMMAFLERHRGFLLNEVIAQGESVEHLLGLHVAGGLLLNRANGVYEGLSEGYAHDIVAEPHVIGLSRELAHRHVASWVGSLFVYQAPRFGFRPSEQRLLWSALAGGTDEERADTLDTSRSAVKQAWRAIYERVATRLPDPDSQSTDR
jgi:DNA-binding CsgD family transcriptional regulator